MLKVLQSKIAEAASGIAARFGAHSVILLYHRVADPVSDPYLLCVSPRHFEEHLEVIRASGFPMHLSKLAELVKDGRVPHGAVCVTFDDGYYDNFSVAAPLLERYDVPATIFATTGEAGRQREFWWDQLESIFFQSASLPSRLELDVGGTTVVWNYEDEQGTAEAVLDQSGSHGGWTVLDRDTPSKRHEMFKRMYVLLQPMPGEAQQKILDQLFRWAQKESFVRETHRAMSREEIVALDRFENIDFGAHTVTHPVLPTLTVARQREEMAQSKSTLERWLGRRIRGFAYPYGLNSDVTAAEAHRTGFEFACACMGRPVRTDADTYSLPRIDVYDWDGDHFVRELRKRLGSSSRRRVGQK